MKDIHKENLEKNEELLLIGTSSKLDDETLFRNENFKTYLSQIGISILNGWEEKRVNLANKIKGGLRKICFLNQTDSRNFVCTKMSSIIYPAESKQHNNEINHDNDNSGSPPSYNYGSLQGFMNSGRVAMMQNFYTQLVN